MELWTKIAEKKTNLIGFNKQKSREMAKSCENNSYIYIYHKIIGHSSFGETWREIKGINPVSNWIWMDIKDIIGDELYSWWCKNNTVLNTILSFAWEAPWLPCMLWNAEIFSRVHPRFVATRLLPVKLPPIHIEPLAWERSPHLSWFVERIPRSLWWCPIQIFINIMRAHLQPTIIHHASTGLYPPIWLKNNLLNWRTNHQASGVDRSCCQVAHRLSSELHPREGEASLLWTMDYY